jgi:prepilin-type N-terminal cleavage/methylation domain-containing protein
MLPRSQSKRQAGFTLIELLVVLTTMVVVLALTGQLLFGTMKATDRQRQQVEARQIARAAVNYLEYMFHGATDLNNTANVRNPLAIMTWSAIDAGARFQVTYNNLTSAQAVPSNYLGDEGTDLITIARADDTVFAPALVWTGFGHSSVAYWKFNGGCPNSGTNLDMFKALSGAHPEPPGNNVWSDPVIVSDSTGAWAMYQITNYSDGNNGNNCSAQNIPNSTVTCNANDGCIKVVANPQTGAINPPGGQPGLAMPIRMHLGVRFVTLRVRNGWLEQKSGIFDPATDNPGSKFTPLLPNVEDMQIAYVFDSGDVRNSTVANQLPELTYPGSVPEQNTALAENVTRVAALRVTITTRSATDLKGEDAARYVRPEAEDHPAGTVASKVFRAQLSSTAMLRNRFSGR